MTAFERVRGDAIYTPSELAQRERLAKSLIARYCVSCGSEIRAERGYVPGFTGMPVDCHDEWHDDEDED